MRPNPRLAPLVVLALALLAAGSLVVAALIGQRSGEPAEEGGSVTPSQVDSAEAPAPLVLPSGPARNDRSDPAATAGSVEVLGTVIFERGTPTLVRAVEVAEQTARLRDPRPIEAEGDEVAAALREDRSAIRRRPHGNGHEKARGRGHHHGKGRGHYESYTGEARASKEERKAKGPKHGRRGNSASKKTSKGKGKGRWESASQRQGPPAHARSGGAGKSSRNEPGRSAGNSSSSSKSQSSGAKSRGGKGHGKGGKKN